VLLFELVGAASLGVWIYLLFGRGGFWRVGVSTFPKLGVVPAKSVVAVIPARNEEAVVGRAIASLLRQHYTGSLRIILVDDHSTDATIAVAGTHERLSIVEAGPLPEGWTGKLWAISEGLKTAVSLEPDFLLLTDADIVHASDCVAGLVARAEADGLDLASYMVKLQCRTLAERALIPAFVFFFLKIYPPSWIVRHDRKTAGAAGGCILIRPSALARIGGIAAIGGELIDDCALARRVKQGGSIWMGLTGETYSIRDYATFGEILRMISRSAFTQLRHSILLLAGTILAMALIYLAPPLLVLSGDRIAAVSGMTAWILMSISYLPTLRFYGRSMVWSLALPLIAAFYLTATVDSAIRYWTGRGGLWKDRVQDSGR
jgi:hopene-associated glycosyltransferase HpnB